MADKTERIVDVNLNRLTEGLKVVEDVVRFGLVHKGLLRSIRALRTKVGVETRALRRRVVLSRQSEKDPGRGNRFDRMARRSLEDVLLANFKRAEESARVLEEVLKVSEPNLSARFKAVRFRLYDLEKKAVGTSQKPKAGATAKNAKSAKGPDNRKSEIGGGLDFRHATPILAARPTLEERCPKMRKKPRSAVPSDKSRSSSAKAR